MFSLERKPCKNPHFYRFPIEKKPSKDIDRKNTFQMKKKDLQKYFMETFHMFLLKKYLPNFFF